MNNFTNKLYIATEHDDTYKQLIQNQATQPIKAFAHIGGWKVEFKIIFAIEAKHVLRI